MQFAGSLAGKLAEKLAASADVVQLAALADTTWPCSKIAERTQCLLAFAH